MTQKLPYKDLFQYGFLALPVAFVGLPLYIYAPDFYATQGGLSLSLIGAIMIFIRLYDAIQDPILGYISQKYAHHSLTLIIAAMVITALSFFMLFHPSHALIQLWFILSLLLLTTSFSILSINLNSLGSLWSQDPENKVRITSVREACNIIGLLMAAILPNIIGFSYTSYLLIGLIIIAGILFIPWYHNHKGSISTYEPKASFKHFKFIFIDKDYRWFFIIYGISMLSASIPGALIIFYVRDFLDAQSLTGVFLLLYFISGGLSMPLWQYLSRKIGMGRAWLLSMLLAIATFSWTYFLNSGDLYPFALICLLSGIAFGAELAIPPAILSALIDKEEHASNTPLYFSGFAFLLKTAFALGSGIAFLILGESGFIPSSDNSEQALNMLCFVYALLPNIIKIIAASVLGLWLYHLNKGDNNNENSFTNMLNRGYIHA